MRAVLQRVSKASVRAGSYRESIGPGILALVAVKNTDTEKDSELIAEKTVNLRIFPDTGGKLNRSVLDLKGEVLAVSQFTLYGDCRKGRRPGFSDCAGREEGRLLFDLYVQKLNDKGVSVKTGVFGEDMKVSLVNDGPVTLIVES